MPEHKHIKKIQATIFHRAEYALWPDCTPFEPGWYFTIQEFPVETDLKRNDCAGPFITYAAAAIEADAASEELRRFLDDPQKGI